MFNFKNKQNMENKILNQFEFITRVKNSEYIEFNDKFVVKQYHNFGNFTVIFSLDIDKISAKFNNLWINIEYKGELLHVANTINYNKINEILANKLLRENNLTKDKLIETFNFIYKIKYLPTLIENFKIDIQNSIESKKYGE